ncbi:MAG: polyketide cyclase [Alphaproteobacteria bacterium]|nr:polyketide cyclase [Alphaproteobacteria bacterium]
MTGIVLAAFALAVLGFLFAASRQPDEFRVARSALIAADAGAVFGHVNELEKWHAWSPWARMEPDAKMTYAGPKAGEGASCEWEGRKTGQGRMTVTESRPDEFIRLRLEFFKPMKAVNTAEFTFTPEGGKTRVEWVMYGKNSFAGKLVGVVMNCHKMVGGQFEDGLVNLRVIAEGGDRKAA